VGHDESRPTRLSVLAVGDDAGEVVTAEQASDHEQHRCNAGSHRVDLAAEQAEDPSNGTQRDVSHEDACEDAADDTEHDQDDLAETADAGLPESLTRRAGRVCSEPPGTGGTLGRGRGAVALRELAEILQDLLATLVALVRCLVGGGVGGVELREFCLESRDLRHRSCPCLLGGGGLRGGGAGADRGLLRSRRGRPGGRLGGGLLGSGRGRGTGGASGTGLCSGHELLLLVSPGIIMRGYARLDTQLVAVAPHAFPQLLSPGSRVSSSSVTRVMNGELTP
jgi:hypothetical protein